MVNSETQKSFWIMLESSILYDKRISNMSKLVYATICSFSNNSDGYCYLTYRQMSKILDIKKRWLYVCIKQLIDNDYILKFSKNNRTYFMPSQNVFVKLRENRSRKISEIFSYDWLNDDTED